MNKPLRNQRGFGIVEVLVAAGLLSIVAYGISTLLINMQIEQKRIQVRSVVTELKNRYAALITSNQSWATTLSNNTATMACLTTPTAYCASGSEVSFFPYYMQGGAAVRFPAAGNNGFTETGSECAGFVAPAVGGTTGTGNDSCPIGFSTVWQPLNLNQPNSMVRVTVRLVYNGSASNKFQNSLETSYKNATTAYPLYQASLPLAKYDLQLVRNTTSVGREFSVYQDVAPGLVNVAPWGWIAASGGGDCAAMPTMTTRSLTSATDATGLINYTAGATTFTFRQAGLYKCSVSSVGFAVNSFRVFFVKGGTVIGSASSFAAKWTQASVNFETSITVTSADVNTTAFYLQQQCQNRPSTGTIPGYPGGLDSYGMGIPAEPYGTPSRFASITCVKMDD